MWNKIYRGWLHGDWRLTVSSIAVWQRSSGFVSLKNGFQCMHPRFWRSTVYLIIFKNHYCWRSHEYIIGNFSYLVAPQPYGLFLHFPYLSVWMFLELLHTLDTNLRLVCLKINNWSCIPNQVKMYYQIWFFLEINCQCQTEPYVLPGGHDVLITFLILFSTLSV